MPDKTKKEKLYAGDVGQSKGGIVGSKGEDMTKQRRDNAQELEGISKGGTQPKNTNYSSMLPEFEVTATKMYGSPAKMDTVDPTTGQVLPADMGQGPTNVGNANTANTLQKQADEAAVKANRAGVPERSASSISQTPMTMQGNFKNDSMAHASRMFGNVANPVPSPSQFNKGLRKASAQGKLDGNPSFKSKVDAAPIKVVPVGAIIKGVQAVGALKSAAKAKGNPEIKGTVLPELEVNYTPKITSGKTTDMTTGAERDSTAKEKASQEKELQSKGDGRTTTSYTNKDGKKVKLKESTKVSF